jgi:membrane protein DedA with SNARE-associated domain
MTSRLLWLAAIIALVLLTGAPDVVAQTADEPAQSVVQQGERFVETEFDKALAKARDLLNRYGYAAVFVANFLEGVGIPAPGEMLTIASAIDAARGSLNIALLLSLVLLAAVVGNSVGYLIGRVGGRPLLRKLPISEARLARVGTGFERYGGWFVLIARFIDGPRQLNGIIAGLLEMPWWRFTFWNVLGALLWVGVWGGGSYWLDRDISHVSAALKRIEPLAIGLVVAALLAGLVYVWRRRHGADRAAGEGS